MFKSRKKSKQETDPMLSLHKLNETLETLEKKEHVLEKKAAAEIQKAKDFSRAKNKKAALQCLKLKKQIEEQMDRLRNMQLRLHDQIIVLEGAKLTTDTFDTLRSGAAAMKAMNKATNIDELDKTMDEINEQTENMKQIQEALAAPVGAAADFDEDELEAELEELENAGLEQEILKQATITTPPMADAPVSNLTSKLPIKPVTKLKTEDEDELASLQAEMAL
ncbi:Vacuolar protein sorting-associated protein 32 homolog 2-like protein [Drosera capensis]